MTTLLSLSPEYFDVVARWLSTAEINCWLSGDWRGREISATMISIAVRNRKNRFFVVRYEERPCALVALSEIEPADKTAMAWYLMGETELRGKGITSHAVRQLIEIAFHQLGLESIYAWAAQNNVASVKLLRKVGFREVGRIRRSFAWQDQQLDRVYFDLTASDFVHAAAPISTTSTAAQQTPSSVNIK